MQFVKERRKKPGLTQNDLAEKSGVGLRSVRGPAYSSAVSRANQGLKPGA